MAVVIECVTTDSDYTEMPRTKWLIKYMVIFFVLRIIRKKLSAFFSKRSWKWRVSRVPTHPGKSLIYSSKISRTWKLMEN